MKDVSLVFSIHVELLFNFVKICNAILYQRLTLSSQNSLIDDSRATQNEQIARHGLLFLNVRIAGLSFVATNHDDISRENFITHDLLPFASPMAPERPRCDSHGTQALEIGQSLKDDGALKEEKHE